MNEAKSAVDRPWKRKLLGFSFLAGKQIRIRLAPQTVERLKAKLRKFTSRTWSIAMPERIKVLNQYLGGWVGYFALAETPSVFERLDEWIRRRLRMDLWKQWKRPRTRYRELRRLGIPDEPAREVAGSSKGYWRLSATPQLHKALGIAYWRAQGLEPLKDSYARVRNSWRTAGCGPACPVV